MSCKSEIVPIRKEKFEMRLFDDEIDTAQFLCFQYDISYEQLFVKLIKEHAEHNFTDNKNYEFNL